MRNYFDTGICPNKRTLDDCYLNMQWTVDQADGDLRKRMLAELKAFRVLNLRFALLKFELDENKYPFSRGRE